MMKPHGGYRPPRLLASEVLDGWASPGARGYRNLFGAAGASEMYRGYLGQENGEERTRDLLDRVSRRMAEPYPWPQPGDGAPAEENRTIPSGYVYLSQFVAHDLSFLSSTFPSINDPLLEQQNLRTIALNLDTVYGGGPLDKPFVYRVPGAAGQPRIFLRLAPVALDNPNGSPNSSFQERDLPRIGCPHLNGPDGHRAHGLTDVLIADPRNDAHPMLAQVLVLFHLLHNAVCLRLQGRGDGLADRDVFAAARAIVTAVYVQIIRKDLLGRLLNDDVRTFYETSGDAPLERIAATAMPVEFSHAAFRCGHVMLRPGYRFNHDSLFGLRDIVQTNSATLPESMPLDRAWLIDWSHFFEIGDTAPNYSRRIGPYYIPFLFDQRTFGTKDGAVQSLPHRDLLRGASICMRSVPSLIRRIPQHLRQGSPLLDDEAALERAITDWLESGSVPFSEEDKQNLSKDPPLLFFILLEAAKTEKGERLGVLGSVIVAEVLYRALNNVILKDEDHARARDVFGGNPPDTMKDLIVWLADAWSLQDPAAGFIGSAHRLSAY
jgi:hypothetical protein